MALQWEIDRRVALLAAREAVEGWEDTPRRAVALTVIEQMLGELDDVSSDPRQAERSRARGVGSLTSNRARPAQ
jgi:hypothetical protein